MLNPLATTTDHGDGVLEKGHLIGLPATERRTQNALDDNSNPGGFVVARIYRAHWRWADSYPACRGLDRTCDQSGIRQTSGLKSFRRKVGRNTERKNRMRAAVRVSYQNSP